MHVTDDPRVLQIIYRMQVGTLTKDEARDAILDLRPAKEGDKIGGIDSKPLDHDETLPDGWQRPGYLFLEWEADDAIKAALGR